MDDAAHEHVPYGNLISFTSLLCKVEMYCSCDSQVLRLSISPHTNGMKGFGRIHTSNSAWSGHEPWRLKGKPTRMKTLPSAVAILLQAVAAWKGQHMGKLPSNSKEKAEFKELIRSWQRKVDGVPIPVRHPLLVETIL